ncbi:MAG: hypothetical protein IKW74_07650, partial [Thermoguttaceae bacterium]|nr:hypothetical protein [Thermoguttaceae bacterium]
LGAKPHIKFSVPIKYVNDYKAGVFNTNVYPPDDWDGYYQFIRALAKNLVDKFGREEVQTWRFGCLVEFENADWFRAKSGDPEETKEAFFKLYDYTVDGLIQEIGPDVFVGAHAMACSEGLWDERELLDHCAHGTNYKTGETGTRICFMAASFYDVKPGVLCPLSLPTVIQRLRERAENVGLTNLIYGVDEGRILGSTKGRDATDLVHRIVGQTYQAASDARLYTQMTENDIDYFSSWTYSTDSPWNGYPTVAWHVANNFSKFRDAALLPINKEEQLAPQVETEAVAGFDAVQNTLHLMAYHFKPEFHFQGTLQTTFTVNVPQFKGQKVSVETFLIDDSNNFFNDWLRDRETFGIDDQCFSWSPDSTAIDHSILDPEKNKIYQEKLRPKYLEKAQIKPIVSEQTVSEDGLLTFETVLGPHAVVFYTVKPVK